METDDDGDVGVNLMHPYLCLRHLDDMSSNHNILEEGLGSYLTAHPLLSLKSMRTLISSAVMLREVLLLAMALE